MMKESATIEEAMKKIVSNVTFIRVIIDKLVKLKHFDLQNFYERLANNYLLGMSDYSLSFNIKSIDILLTLEPENDSLILIYNIIGAFYPEIISNDEFRGGYLSAI